MKSFWNWPTDFLIPWSPENANFTHPNQFVALALPWVIILIVFIFRKQLSNASQKAKNITYTSLGIFAIIWEFWFDISKIAYRGQGVSEAMFIQFRKGFDFCRMLTYINGVFLIFRRADLIKWVAATSLFSGYSTLIDHYEETNSTFHSLFTHTIILSAFPSVAFTMSAKQYKVRNLIHAHLFNWTLVAIMVITNYVWNAHTFDSGNGYHAVAGELTQNRMKGNMIVGEIPWPGSMFVWILLVMLLEWSYFGVSRLIIWRTHQKELSFIQTFVVEWEKDKKEWYGFKNIANKQWWKDNLLKLTWRWDETKEVIYG